MDDRQNGNPQPGLTARFTAMWQTLDKKQWATIGGVVVTISALVVAGLHKGVPWYLVHKQ
jgi:ABC-type transport system involved in cytochrome c biogenesis permease subunit